MPANVPISAGSGTTIASDEITSALTGTVAKAATISLTGTGTAFLTQLGVGMVVRVPGGTGSEDRVVAGVTTDTAATVTVAFTTTASAQTGLRVLQAQYVKLLDATAAGTGSALGPLRTLANAQAPAAAQEVGAVIRGRNANDSNWYTAEVYDGSSDAGSQFWNSLMVNARLQAWDGTNVVRLRADASKNLLVAVNAALPAGTNSIGTVSQVPAIAMATAVSTSGGTITLTLAAPGAGLFHYITEIDLTAYATAARTGSATPWTVTTTNIAGTPAFTFSTAAAIGSVDRMLFAFTLPLRSSAANAATTFVMPAATGVIWRVNVAYYTSA